VCPGYPQVDLPRAYRTPGPAARRRSPRSIRLTVTRLTPASRAISCCVPFGLLRRFDHGRALLGRQPPPHGLAPGRQRDTRSIRHAPHRRIAPSAPALAGNQRRMRLRCQSRLDRCFLIVSNRDAAWHLLLIDIVWSRGQVPGIDRAPAVFLMPVQRRFHNHSPAYLYPLPSFPQRAAAVLNRPIPVPSIRAAAERTPAPPLSQAA
jgi:hypothetical protein